MGLDMYLTKKVYVGANYKHNKITGSIDLQTDGKPIPVNLNAVVYIEEIAGCWRKANAIHRWFVENVQNGEDNCKKYYVSEEDMENLLKSVNAVLKDHSLAPVLLPTASGFFFGKTDYDEYYFQDLEETQKILTQALSQDGEYYYRSSW